MVQSFALGHFFVLTLKYYSLSIDFQGKSIINIEILYYWY